jgi:hypothetical protein
VASAATPSLPRRRAGGGAGKRGSRDGTALEGTLVRSGAIAGGRGGLLIQLTLERLRAARRRFAPATIFMAIRLPVTSDRLNIKIIGIQLFRIR